MHQMWKVLFRKKNLMSPIPFLGELRQLSVIDTTCLGLATTLGTGVYTLIAVAAHDHAGPSVVLAILAAAVTACLGGLCYSEVVTRFPKGGSAYSYAYATCGELLAFIVGWGMVLEYSVGTALAAKAFSQYLDVVFDDKISHSLRQHLGSLSIRGLDEHLDFPSITIIIIVAILLLISVKMLYSLTNVLVVINLLVISGVVLVGIFNMDSENWIAGTGFFPGKMSGVFSAASLCFFAFVGYDILALCTIDSPHRSSTYPTMVSTVFLIGLLGTFSMAVVLTLLVPYSLLEVKGSVLQAFDLRQVVGMRYFAAVGAISGLVSAVIASIFSLIKLLQSLSNDGLLFRFLCRSQCHTTITATILCCILSFFSDLNALVHVLGMGTMISSIAVAVSVLCLQYGVSTHLYSTSNSLELSEDSSIGSSKPTEKHMDSQSQKDPVRDKYYTKTDYGSLRGRSLSVDLVDESYVTCLTEMSPHWTKQEPTHRSAATAAGLIAAAMLVMLLMGVMTLHIPRILPRSRWWTELVAFILFLIIVAFSAAICYQPKHKAKLRNRVPCVPFLPLSAILMDVHLIVGLPYTSWIVFFIWSLIGTLLYVCYGIWNSSERQHQDAQSVNLLSANEELNDSDNVQQDALQ